MSTKTLNIQGDVITPGHSDYEQARRVFNGMIDRRPSLIARCASADDVAATVAYARDGDLPLAIRGGGHNVAGDAVCDGGVVIDLSNLRHVQVDPGHKVAIAGPGATWGDFDRATQACGLATTGGLISTTGVAGLTLGGGVGWLVRKFGLACDNLVAADVVTSNGTVVRAALDDGDAELLWGLRGGGGNFGVVTAFEFRLHPLGQVVGGMVGHPRGRARAVLQLFRDVCASAPDELTMIAALMTTPEGHPAIGIAACYAGSGDEAQTALARLHEFGPPVMDQLGPIPYPELQTALDPTAPRGALNYWRSGFLTALSDETIEVIVEHANQMTSPLSMIHIHHLGGRASQEPPGGAAFAHRDAQFVYNLIGMWTESSESDSQIALVRRTSEALRPLSMDGGYVNFMGGEGPDQVRAAYGGSFDRLARLKSRFDPGNLFHVNQNISPLGVTDGTAPSQAERYGTARS